MKNIIIELLKDKIGRIGLIGVCIVILVALFAPVIAPYNPIEMFPQIRNEPVKQFIMGTDNYGRDVF